MHVNKFEFSVLIVQVKCIIATQLRSPIKPLRSLHMLVFKLYRPFFKLNKLYRQVRHNADCLVLTADRSKIRPFKSMVKLLHTRNFKQPL